MSLAALEGLYTILLQSKLHRVITQ